METGGCLFGGGGLVAWSMKGEVIKQEEATD